MTMAGENKWKEKRREPSNQQASHDPRSGRESTLVISDEDTAEKNNKAQFCEAQLKTLNRLNSPFDL